MRKRDSHVVCLSVLIALLVIAPAFAAPPVGWTKVYTMDSPWNSSGDWTDFDSPPGTPYATWSDTSAGAGFLHQANALTNEWSTKFQTSAVGAATDWTIEVNAKVNTQGTYGGSTTDCPAGLTLTVMNTSLELTEMVIQSSAIKLRTGAGTWQTIDNGSNTSYGAIRLTKDAVGVRVWRIGAEQTLVGGLYTVSADTPGYTGAVGQIIQFGDNSGGGSTGGSDFDIDYLAFDIGSSHVPEPTTILVMAAGFAACLLSKRRG